MTDQKRGVIAAALACAAACAAPLPALAQRPPEQQEPTAAELRQQIEALQSRVAELEAEQKAPPPRDGAAPRPGAARDQVLADAEARSDSVLAGHEGGKFFLRSADETFTLNPGAQLQIRYTANSRDDAGDDDLQDGFEIRRAKFNFGGNAFSEDFTYNLQWETNEEGGGVTLEEAWVRYAFADDWAIRLGQFKDDVFHEETVSSKRQLAVDRSLVNELLAGGETDYVQGARLEWDATEAMRLNVAVHDGYNSDNTPFTEDGGSGFVGVEPTEWGVSGRVEFFALGGNAKKQYDDFSAMKNKENLLVVGAGADYSMAGNNHALFHTVDAQYETTNGLGVYAAVVGLDRQTSGDTVLTPELNLYDWGGLVQAGYMFNEDWEGFGRWSVTFLDDDQLAAGDEDTINEFTVGVNRYFHGHAAKFTIDASYLPDGAPNNERGIGVLASDEEQFIVRGQFQFLL